jgi:hypothetical protein
MKATISASGCLVIKAETDLEAYALEQWSKSYRPPSDEDASFPSILLIDFKPGPPPEGEPLSVPQPHPLAGTRFA